MARPGRISSRACRRSTGSELHPHTDVPPALAAFLRGSERRAWVFLWLQGGDPDAADHALAGASRTFKAEAGQLPMAEWPARFWRLLATCPLEAGSGHWPGELEVLAGPAPADRRALLLRLAGGLDEEPAADALGIPLETYRERLAAACPRDAAGEVDVAAWHRLAQAIQHAARELPESRLERIAALRQTALAGAGSPEAPAAASPERPAPRRARRRSRWWPALLLVLLALLAGAALWWWRQPGSPLPPAADADGGPAVDDLRVHDPGPILVEPLPDPGPPAVPAEPMPRPLEELPADPVVADLALLAWYAAGAPESRIEREEDGLAPVQAPTAPEGGPPPQQAWAGLPAHEQARLREAGARFLSLPPDEQQRLRQRFAALDGMERRGWLFGPELGNDWPRLQPWLGYVPEEERVRLLQVLRGMDGAQRAQLAEVLRRQSPAGRIELRRELLALPPARSGSWLEEAARR